MATTNTQAHFSPKLKFYYFMTTALMLVVTVVGILVLPLWAIFGTWWARRYYESLKLQITDRNIVIAKGVFFKQELTIPLDKIQDISIREGPLLNHLGLLGLRIETAGQRNAATGQSEADLIGVIDARQVRDEILARRDALALSEKSPSGSDSTLSLLSEIRDSLQRIEAKLG